MIKKLLVAMMAVGLLLSQAVTPGSAATVRATIVEENVVLNGITINNVNAGFPLLRHRNITYIPLTYNLARFMGLTTQWSQREGLIVTRAESAGAFIADETTINQSGDVTVTIPTYGITVNGKRINNRNEPWPLLNFRGVTYFPLTWRFAVDEFGWSYHWSVEGGLRINAVPSDRGSLENLLAIINKDSFANRKFAGSLLDKAANTTEEFDASKELVFIRARSGGPADAELIFRHAPLVLARIGSGFVGPGTPSIGVIFANSNAAIEPTLTTRGNYIGHGGKLVGEELASAPRAYLLRCFLRLRFIGVQRERLLSAELIASSASTETWQLLVDMPDAGFFRVLASTQIRVDVEIDKLRGRVVMMVLENDQFRLTTAVR
ncbi:MAG: hypothetical protein KGZ50_00405 [Peptococcaceae bacterium]|nr:hypothetical protein [Peptococcaceae bacterium]